MAASSIFFLALSNVLGGSSFAATARALRWLGPFPVVFWRTAIAAVLLFPGLRGARLREISAGAWARMAAVGFFGLAAPVMVGAFGQTLSSAANASLLVGFEPVSIVLLSAMFLGERLGWVKAFAVAAGLAGSALIVLQGGFRLTPGLRGDLLLFAQGFLWALYTVIGKGALEEVSPGVFTALTTLFALVPMGAAAAATHAGLPPPQALPALLFLGAGVGWLATWAWNKGLEKAAASKVALFVFLQPVVGVLLGVLLEGERLTAWSAAGGALILLGVYAAARSKEAADEGQGLPVREVLDVPQGA